MNGPSVSPRVLDDFSAYLDVTGADLIACRDWINQGDAYRQWPQAKGNGRGFRLITSPRKELKKVQRRLLRRLLYGVQIHGSAHGFTQGRSILTNAAAHRDNKARTIFGIDLKGAFPSVSEDRVRNTMWHPVARFLRTQTSGRVVAEAISGVLNVLVKLCCHNGCLPQGSPTSPALLNIALLELDRQLTDLARRFGLRMTRYADDITFSTSAAQIPCAFVDELRGIIGNTGWTLNQNKTVYLRRGTGREMEITGIVLQEDGRFTVPTKRLVRYEDLMLELLDGRSLSEHDEAVARGIIVYVSQVYGGHLPRRLGHLWKCTRQKFRLQPPKPRARVDVNFYMPDVPSLRRN